MTSLKNLAVSAAALALLALAPMTAHAITVECALKDGSTCTVSNDPVDSVSCMCADESGTGSSGAEDWADFDEEMLLEICMAELEFCSFAGTDSATTGAADTGVGDGTGTSTGGGESSTGAGTTGAGTTGPGTTGDPTGAGSGPSTDPAETTGSSASGGDSGPAATSGTGPTPSSGGSSSSGADEASEDPSGCSVGGRTNGALLALFGLVLGVRRRRVRCA